MLLTSSLCRGGHVAGLASSCLCVLQRGSSERLHCRHGLPQKRKGVSCIAKAKQDSICLREYRKSSHEFHVSILLYLTVRKNWHFPEAVSHVAWNCCVTKQAVISL